MHPPRGPGAHDARRLVCEVERRLRARAVPERGGGAPGAAGRDVRAGDPGGAGGPLPGRGAPRLHRDGAPAPGSGGGRGRRRARPRPRGDPRAARGSLRLPGHHALRVDAARQPGEPDLACLLRRAANPPARPAARAGGADRARRAQASRAAGRPPAAAPGARDEARADPRRLGRATSSPRRAGRPWSTRPAPRATARWSSGSRRFSAASGSASSARTRRRCPCPAGGATATPSTKLYHLLNHHLIFGGHYGRQALGMARRYA